MRRLLLLGLLLLLLAGCVDYSEELWLNRNGSGRVKMLVGVLTTYENKQEINRYLDQPGISLISKSVYRKDKYTYYRLDFRFSSLEAFNNLNEQVSNADFFGRITLKKEEDGTITFKRRIALGSVSGDDDEIEQLIFQHPLGNLKWSYKLHLPWKIIKANATVANIDLKENTVSWEYLTSYLWNKSQTMTVSMQPSLPVQSMLLAALAFIVILISIFWWRRHFLKISRNTEQIAPVEPAKE
jgi:hypothetical protein